MDYNNYHGYWNSTNMFSVSDDGEKTICSSEGTLYLEDWQEEITSAKRITQLSHRMDNPISFVRADFERDFVACGDFGGYVMIQRISKNEILFHKTEIFERRNQIISSSIFNHYLCVGNVVGNIGTIDLDTFTVNSKLTFELGTYVTLLDIVRIETEAYLISSGSS
jgi:hypothetical protein